MIDSKIALTDLFNAETRYAITCSMDASRMQWITAEFGKMIDLIDQDDQNNQLKTADEYVSIFRAKIDRMDRNMDW